MKEEALSSYQKLQQLVQEGKLELIHVLALPRSNGTALQLALTQASEVTGQLNEPFTFNPDKRVHRWDYIPQKPARTIEDGCQHILKRYEEASSSGKVKLVIHESCLFLTDDEFRKLLKLNSHQVFVIRDPLKNAFSWSMRLANDMISEFLGNKLKPQDFSNLIASPKNFKTFITKNPDKISLPSIHKLVNKPQDAATPLTDEDFNLAYKNVIDAVNEKISIGWENMYHYFKVAENEFPDHPRSVFDGIWLFENPEDSLKRLTQRIDGITFSSAMINNWTKGVGKDFHCINSQGMGNLAPTNAWSSPASNSKGISLQQDSAGSFKITLESLPKEIQDVIKAQEPIYREMLSKAV